MSVNDIYKNALSQLGIPFDITATQSTTTARKLDGQVEFKFPVIAGTNISGEMAVERNNSTSVDDFQQSIANLEFIAQAITHSGKRLVIEDFHYLTVSERNRIAHDLKTLWDYRCFVVLVGIWTQTNLLTSLNPDLTGRISETSVFWSDADLNSVIEKGSKVLNIDISKDLKQVLINDSFGNVGILQSLLLKLVEDEAGIEETASATTTIADPELLNRAAKSYADQLDGYYQQFAKRLSAGIRSRKKATGIYAYAMEAIVSASDQALIEGFSRDEIFWITNKKQPRIQKGNLKTVLGKLVELQEPEKENSMVISYDESIDAIFVVDRQLLFYRKYHTMRWPWKDMVAEAEEHALSDLDDEN